MHKRIKILFTIPNFDTAGSGKVVYDLVKGLDKSKFEAEICCFHDRGAYFETIKSLGVKIHIFQFTASYRPYLSLPIRIIRITRFFKKYEFDIIHSWHWSSDFTEPLAARIAGIPFVYTKKAMGWGNKSWRWRSKLSTKIIAINEDMCNYFEHMMHKIERIPLGVDTEYFKYLKKSNITPENLNVEPNDFVVVSVANLVPIKGIETLLEAVQILNNPRVKVLIIGAKDSDYAQDLMKRFQNEKYCMFLGKKLDVRPYLAVSDVFVIPTKHMGEGLPIAPLEAMASGRIVIGSEVSGVRDILKDFKPFLFEAGNVHALAKILNQIMNMTDEERLGLGEQMKSKVHEAFSLKRCIENHERLFMEIA